jgi:hypothetical protein
MSGPKRGEVKWKCRKLHIEELYDLYSSPKTMRKFQIMKNKMSGVHNTCGERSGVDGVLVGKLEENRPLGKHKPNLG